VTAAPPKSDNVIDLMEALRRSLEGKVAPETPPPRAKAKRRAAK
jgi:non-homologous end joining protein Ku